MNQIRQRYESGAREIKFNEAGDPSEVMYRKRHQYSLTLLEMIENLHSFINPSVHQSFNPSIEAIRQGYQAEVHLLDQKKEAAVNYRARSFVLRSSGHAELLNWQRG